MGRRYKRATRVLKARYYGEINYIDQCLGRVLDAVEAHDDGDNTIICFFTDHGDHMGDHGGRKRVFSTYHRIPFLLVAGGASGRPSR